MSEAVCTDPANEMLPWYVNGTLGEDDEARVQKHLAMCAVCGDEVDHLAEFARAMAEQDTTMHPQGTVHPLPSNSRPSRPSRVPILVAASLLLPAILGVYWAALGFPTVPRAAASHAAALRPLAPTAVPRLQATAILDLGAGTMRGVGKVASIVLDPGVERVAASLVLPVVPESPLGMELLDSKGSVLARATGVRASDDRLVCVYSLPANVFTASGEYAIVLSESPSGHAARTYRYTFRVTLSAPRS